MKIAIVGNGYDLRQGFKTGFNDFLEYFNRIYLSGNLVYLFFSRMNNSNGWLDFEMQLQQFLICYSEFSSLPSYEEPNSQSRIELDEYIKSQSHYEFCNILPRVFGFLSLSPYYDNIYSTSSEWRIPLEQKVNNDIMEIKNKLKEYLSIIEQDNFHNFNPKNTSELTVLKTVDKVITFNYTKFLEKITPLNKITYAHGKLENDFVLGVPYTTEIKLQSLNIHFKTSQSIFNNYLCSIINKIEITHFIFIGFSFGKSDHYFFQEIINNKNLFNKLGHYFVLHCYYYDQNSKYQTISNLREFFGESEFVQMSRDNQIRFYDYNDSFSPSWFE